MSDQPTTEAPARFAPPESPAGAPFWAASRERRLTLPWCTVCGQPHWYPRGFCPHCLSDAVEWRASAGTGTVHAVSVMPKPAHPGLAPRGAYAVVLVDLDDGVRMMLQASSASGVDDVWSIAVGDAVTVGWEPLPDGRHLPTAEVPGR